jgi:putative membrane protein
MVNAQSTGSAIPTNTPPAASSPITASIVLTSSRPPPSTPSFATLASIAAPPYRVRVRSFLLRAAVVAVTLVVIAQVLPQVVVPESVVDLIGIAALFGVSNALVRPVVHLLALPVRLATLGLATFALNGALVLGIAWLAGQLGLGFSVGGFPPDLSPASLGVAVAVAAALGVVSTAASLLVPDL